MGKKSPVLLVTFNRPDLAIRVLNQIRLYQPERLYLASDGARTQVAGESELVNKTRAALLEAIDWDCEVKTLFREENVGCGLGPASAISWMFETEEYGIILEDDCIPQTEFFGYCENLLERYKDDQRVWVVSGRNNYPVQKYFQKYDYLFLNYAATWGWATWKRCWDVYDINMPLWSEFQENGGHANVHFSKLEARYIDFAYMRMFRDKSFASHIWDFQFNFAMKIHGGLGIVPRVNLIENVGYEGTHFSGMKKALQLKSQSGFTFERHPLIVLPDRAYQRCRFHLSLRNKILDRVNAVARKLRLG